MYKLAFALALSTAGVHAQTADIGYFRAVMLPSNEVPPTPAGPTGVADIVAHVVRDASGQIVSGTVDFNVRSTFPADVTFTGLHIHAGPAGVNAGVVINTGLSGTATVVQKGGESGVVFRKAHVPAESAAGVAALRGMFNDPSQYYVNIHSTEFGGGVIRGQLQRARRIVLMGLMSSENEVPAVTNGVQGSGVAQVIATGTWDDAGRLTSGVATLSTTYTLSQNATFTGFHIHPGAAGASGPVAIGASIPAGLTAEANAAGILPPASVQVPPTEINLSSAAQVAAFNGLFTNPRGYYINAHTTANTSGVIRAQLRPTDELVFPANMLSGNEPGTVSVNASAPSLVIVNSLRNADGTIAAATVTFDVNYRFPGGANFTGLHIHDGRAGVNGGVTVGMIPQNAAAFSSETGSGNFFGWTAPVSGGAGLATLNSMLKNPENHYLNLHTSADPGGAVRAQLGPAVTTAASVAAVIAANQDRNAVIVAPGSLVSIYGSNLGRVAGGIEGWEGTTLPESLNGAAVTIGGRPARLYYVSPGQINAVVPFEAAAGQQPVLVNNGNGPSAAFNVTVANTAPAIFFSPVPAVVKNSDFSLVTASNPAAASDIIVVYCTGLGAVTPSVPSGQLVTAGTIANTAPVTATIGGQDSAVIYSIASPGATGLYQVALRVPSGVSGTVPLVLRIGGASSNSVDVTVR